MMLDKTRLETIGRMVLECEDRMTEIHRHLDTMLKEIEEDKAKETKAGELNEKP